LLYEYITVNVRVKYNCTVDSNTSEADVINTSLNSLLSMEFEVQFLYSQEHDTGPYATMPLPYSIITPYFSKNSFNSTPSTLWSPEYIFLSDIATKIPHAFLITPMHPTCLPDLNCLGCMCVNKTKYNANKLKHRSVIC
jgi:hypothetical protein